MICGLGRLLAAILLSQAAANLTLDVAADGKSFNLTAPGQSQPLLEGLDIFAFVEGRWHSGSELNLIKGPTKFAGSDNVDKFSGMTATWVAIPEMVQITTIWRVYQTYGAAVFDVHLPDGANATNPLGTQNCTGSAHCAWAPSITFPSFRSTALGLASRTCMTWEGNQVFSHTVTRGLMKLPSSSPNGIQSGPVVCYDASNPRGGLGALMVAPVARALEWAQNNSATPGRWDMGPSGELTSLISGTIVSTMVTFSPSGPSDAVMAWGTANLLLHQTARPAPDVTLTSLGYWTDHGAQAYFFQYSNPLEYGVPGTVLGDWYTGTRQQVPLRYLQLDAWWYATDGWNACVENWAPHEEYFAEGAAGVRALHERIGAPLDLYQNYFCPHSNYSDKFDMMLSDDGRFALPVPEQSQRFYEQLWAQGSAQGMAATEIDYLSVTWPSMSVFRSQQGAAAAWLGGMAAAAESAGVGLQACMLLPLYVSAMPEFGGFTNARGSPDFWRDTNVPGDNLFAMPYSSLLLHAVGLRASKDTLWTSWPQPIAGGMTNVHANPQTHIIVAALSTGPVGLSDFGNGTYTNVSLVMRSCNSNGTLIQPSRPATIIDSILGVLTDAASGGFALPGLPIAGSTIAFAHADVPAPQGAAPPPRAADKVWRVVSAPAARSWVGVAFNVTELYSIVADDLRPAPKSLTAPLVYRVWPDMPDSCANGGSAASCVLQAPSSGIPVRTGAVEVSKEFESKVLTVYEPTSAGWIFLGDLSKFVTASANRFTELAVTAQQLSVTVLGAAGEHVTVTAITPHQVVRTSTLVVGQSGSAVARLDA